MWVEMLATLVFETFVHVDHEDEADESGAYCHEPIACFGV